MPYNPKFDLDLQFGEAGENWLRWIGTDQAKVEVKTERDQWYTTGNVVFEFRYKGRPSGIASTEADLWAIVFKLGDGFCGALVYPVIELKEFLRSVYKSPEKYGAKVMRVGDNDDSLAILVPIDVLVGGIRLRSALGKPDKD